MAHPSRRRKAERLAIRHGGRVVYDPRPGDPPSAWRTSREAWTHRHPPATTHRLVLQDDAQPHPDLLAKALSLVTLEPESMIAFYVGSIHAVYRDYRRHERVSAVFCPLPRNHFVPTVALAMPLDLAADAVGWLDKKLPPTWALDDEAWKLYRQAHQRVEALATIPCLVGHDNRMVSVMQHRHHGRRFPISPPP
jgi:hypothetical protein